MRRRTLLAGVAAAVWLPAALASEAAAWAALRAGGAVLLMRHAATEPGIGDPPGFRHGDCATQRQLSAVGRAQARALGREFTARGVRFDVVVSSRWCRCLDTARLVFPAQGVEALPALDSFFDDTQRGPAQTAALRDWLARLPEGQSAALVTHMVNIAALVDENLAVGEALVLRRRQGHWMPVGRLALPPA